MPADGLMRCHHVEWTLPQHQVSLTIDQMRAIEEAPGAWERRGKQVALVGFSSAITTLERLHGAVEIVDRNNDALIEYLLAHHTVAVVVCPTPFLTPSQTEKSLRIEGDLPGYEHWMRHAVWC